MVHRTYLGLGSHEAAVREFEKLAPYVAELLELRRCCRFGSADHQAIGVALDGIETAAFHFTRRRHFYHEAESEQGAASEGNGRLSDRAEALAAFRALAPHADQIGKLRMRCRPFGREDLALGIALESLETAAFHFTRDANLYRARSDFGGPIR